MLSSVCDLYLAYCMSGKLIPKLRRNFVGLLLFLSELNIVSCWWTTKIEIIFGDYVAQLIDCRVSNQKVAKPWCYSQTVARYYVLGKNSWCLFPSWDQEVYPSSWPRFTKDIKQNHSMLERYDRHRV